MNDDTEVHHPATHVHVSSARTRDEDVDAPATAWMRAIVRAMARDRRGNRTE